MSSPALASDTDEALIDQLNELAHVLASRGLDVRALCADAGSAAARMASALGLRNQANTTMPMTANTVVSGGATAGRLSNCAASVFRPKASFKAHITVVLQVRISLRLIGSLKAYRIESLATSVFRAGARLASSSTGRISNSARPTIQSFLRHQSRPRIISCLYRKKC